MHSNILTGCHGDPFSRFFGESPAAAAALLTVGSRLRADCSARALKSLFARILVFLVSWQPYPYPYPYPFGPRRPIVPLCRAEGVNARHPRAPVSFIHCCQMVPTNHQFPPFNPL